MQAGTNECQMCVMMLNWLPYPDAKVAQILAAGGPCYYYLLPEEMHLTNTAGGAGGGQCCSGRIPCCDEDLSSEQGGAKYSEEAI